MSSAVMKLNNYLQKTGRTAQLSWLEHSDGPANALNWTVKCKLSGQVIGEAASPKKSDAKEAAAAMALRRLGQ
ncbi:hypothetical protein FOMPIDRAFT_87900 [Fomitopsis schrenkii]|uniref:DRBM domain-containing protein n=1 Tax=Fomitopsis schrenkii TaxID=2126942 RepID=S8FZ49_FOMSC|nr:hypothetical protein FOMPIDRAFT_87900 [Fomitopsis schrenkii]